MNKQNVVYSYDRMLFDYKEAWSTDHMIGCYLTIKRHGVLIHPMTKMNIANILTERSQTQMYYMIPVI